MPWKELGIELVFECTGALIRRDDLEKHVRAGARFVLLSAPSKDESIATVVHGVNTAGGDVVRAPIPVGSIADVTFVTSRSTSVDEVNGIFIEEAATKRYAGVLGVSSDALVSSDIIGDSRASVIDLELTKVIDGDLVKIMSWYDNEWGYASQMVREALALTGGR